MKDVSKIIEEDKKFFTFFISPLTNEEETILFGAIDILHNIEREGWDKAAGAKRLLLEISITAYATEKINKAIIEIQRLIDAEGGTLIVEHLKRVLEVLFAIKLNQAKIRRDYE